MNLDRVFATLALATAGLASAWLFLAEMVTAKMLMPRFGGAPSVWIVCLAFFQAALVAGSLHADVLARRLTPGAQVLVQAAVVASAIALTPAYPGGALSLDRGTSGNEVLQVVASLAAIVGGSFFAIAGLGPLIAHWRTRWAAGQDPPADAAYRLSVAANAGSAVALLSYPFVIESLAGLSDQWLLLGRAFLFAACSALACGWYACRSVPQPASASSVPAMRSSLGDIAVWAALAAIPASWLAGVTAHLTVEVAPIPLLWTVPLAAYLASYAIVFAPGGRRWRPWEPAMLLTAIAVTVVLLAGGFEQPVWIVLGLHLAAFFCASLALHGRLFDRRPPAGQLTAFYLTIAVGGALGGLFNALVAPFVFDARHEYPIAVLAATCWTTGLPRWLRAPRLQLLLAAAFIVTFLSQERADGVVHRSRSFFGVLRVCDDDNGPSRNLRHGGIIHGVQLVSEDPARRAIPLSYYHPSGPLGSVFRGLEASGGPRRVGVAGLGIGTIAAYGREGQEFSFFEIDPDVVRIARDPRWFTFLAETAATTRIVTDDARAAIAREPDAAYDLLVIDAFTGDAVPTHLLTREALALYGVKVAPAGCVAFHISNRYLDFAPIIATLARDGGWMALLARDDRVPADYARTGSRWMVLGRSLDVVKAIHDNPTSDLWRWTPAVRDGGQPWTDDRSALAEALDFGSGPTQPFLIGSSDSGPVKDSR